VGNFWGYPTPSYKKIQTTPIIRAKEDYGGEIATGKNYPDF
jgi:hypothetical protein